MHGFFRNYRTVRLMFGLFGSWRMAPTEMEEERVIGTDLKNILSGEENLTAQFQGRQIY